MELGKVTEGRRKRKKHREMDDWEECIGTDA
jgi:hypothetical protein